MAVEECAAIPDFCRQPVAGHRHSDPGFCVRGNRQVGNTTGPTGAGGGLYGPGLYGWCYGRDDGAAGLDSAAQAEEQDIDDHGLRPAADRGVDPDSGAGFCDADPGAILSRHRARPDAAWLFQRCVARGVAAIARQCGGACHFCEWDGLHRHATVRPVPVRVCRPSIAVLDLRRLAGRDGRVRLESD